MRLQPQEVQAGATRVLVRVLSRKLPTLPHDVHSGDSEHTGRQDSWWLFCQHKELWFVPIKVLSTRDFWKRSFLRDGGQCSEACFLDTRLTR